MECLPMLYRAIDDNNVDEFRRLINCENCNSKNEYGWTPLHLICWRDRRDMYDYVMSTFGKNEILLNEQSNSCWTPLTLACEYGHKEIIKDLILRGADINVKSGDGYTPLMWACRNGDKEIAQALILRGADMNIKNNDGYTPLMLACDNEHREIVQALILGGADINIINNWFLLPWGNTAFDYLKTEEMKQMYNAAVETRRKQLSEAVDPSSVLYDETAVTLEMSATQAEGEGTFKKDFAETQAKVANLEGNNSSGGGLTSMSTTERTEEGFAVLEREQEQTQAHLLEVTQQTLLHQESLVIPSSSSPVANANNSQVNA